MNKAVERVIIMAKEKSIDYAITHNIETKEYKEIQDLFRYCVKKEITCFFVSLMDGYILIFKDNTDFVQHFGSYVNNRCVEYYNGVDEPTIMNLDEAKLFVESKRR